MLARQSAPSGVRTGRNLAVPAALVAGAAVGGSLATEPDGPWYQGLRKPSWNPPNRVIPIVWTSLYALVAGTSAAVLNELDRRGQADDHREYTRALATNLTINGAWSWLFFRANSLPASTLGAAVLALDSLRLARRAGEVDPKYGRLLAPYVAWTSFATVLTATLWRLNRD